MASSMSPFAQPFTLPGKASSAGATAHPRASRVARDSGAGAGDKQSSNAPETYTSNGTVFFVQKGEKGSGRGGDKDHSAYVERPAVTPAGQRVYILPKAINAELHILKEQ